MNRRFRFEWLVVFATILVASVDLHAPAADAGWNVRSLGAVGDGKTKDTAAFQKALDQCAAAGGGVVLVPPGDYLIGSIAIKSSTTLVLQPGAILRGTADLTDYPIVKARWEGRWVDAHRALVSAQDADHIAVIGPGEIIGNPALGGRQMPRRPCIVETIHCDDVHLEDFSASQRLMWTIHPTTSTNVEIDRLTIRGVGGNSDGVDVDSCKHVRIEYCDIQTGDDCVAIKSGRGMEGYKEADPTEDVLISRCAMGDNIFACVGVGSETSGGIRGVRIEDCKFNYANSAAIYIKTRIGRGAFIDNISGDDLDVSNAKQGFLRINLTTSGLVDSEQVPGDEGIPSGKNYRFSNVRITGSGALLTATDISPIKPLDGLTLENISGTCERGMILCNVKNADFKNIQIGGFTGPRLAIQNVSGAGLEGAMEYVPTTKPTTRASTMQ